MPHRMEAHHGDLRVHFLPLCQVCLTEYGGPTAWQLRPSEAKGAYHTGNCNTEMHLREASRPHAAQIACVIIWQEGGNKGSSCYLEMERHRSRTERSEYLFWFEEGFRIQRQQDKAAVSCCKYLHYVKISKA